MSWWYILMATMGHRIRQAGFTIVELLIVIVVIAILAAITIVVFNGVQQRAQGAAASAALVQAKKKLDLYRVDNSAYPTSGNLAAAGVSNSNVSYQYSSTSGTSFCLTATNQTVSYNVTDNASPASGACIGHTSGGAPLATNLISNPSFETNTTGWYTLAGATMARAIGGSGVVAGDASLEAVATTENQSGVQYNIPGLAASTTYTFSIYITPLSGDTTDLGLREGDGMGTRDSQTFSPILTLGQTVRKSLTFTTSTSPVGSAQVWRQGGTASSNVTFRIDAAMLELGSTATAYSE